MQKWKNMLLCFAVTFMFLFIAVGYAQISGELSITGNAKYEIAAIYITEVRISSVSGVGGQTPSVTKTGTLTFEHNNYNLRAQVGSTAGGSFTVHVTVKNNSGVDQYLLKHTASSASDIEKLKNTQTSYSQQLVADRLVPQGESRTFVFTVQNTSTSSALYMNKFESLLVFSPNFSADTTENATNALTQAFLNVLAGNGPNGDGKGIEYVDSNGKTKKVEAKKILDEIVGKMTSVDTGGYTGNVGNATQAEKNLVEAIFGENMVIQLGSNYYSVCMLIKNQKIVNKDDMVIYVTADPLEVGGGTWNGGTKKWDNLRIIPVYALVFLKDGTTYTYVDHIFAGEAPVCDFKGALGDGKVGNLHTNIWNSTEFPSVTDKSGGSIGQQNITTNGELDEAYQFYINSLK